jgi:hypothetical protein
LHPLTAVQVLLQACDAALTDLASQPQHALTLILNARKRLITLSNPSSSPFDVAAACQFFEAQPQVANHIAALQSLAEIEGGAIETVSQAAKDAPELPSFLSNERFSLDTVLSSQASAVNIEQAKQCVPDHFLAALVAPSLSQKNFETTMKIVNALDSTAIWPASIPSTSHLSQHRGAPGACSIFAPFSRGSGCAIISFSQFSTVIAHTPIAPGTKAYFEVHILSAGADPQFGLATEKFAQSSVYTGDGVGDDEHSWGVDGVRHKLWHKGGMPGNVSWSEGDVVGFAVDAGEYNCHVSVNGRPILTFDIIGAKGGGSVFSKTHTLFPAFSCGNNCRIKINFGEDPFCHPVHAVRLLTAPPPAAPAPSLVDTIVQYIQTERVIKGVATVDPVSMWGSSSITRLRANLTLDQMWQIAKLCPKVASSGSFLEGLFDRHQFDPQGHKVVTGSLQHVLQICATADAVVRQLPNQTSGIALALSARILFHRLFAMQALGTCDAAQLERYLKMKREHFLEHRCVNLCSSVCASSL